MIRNQTVKKATKHAENKVLRVFMAIVLNFFTWKEGGGDAVDAPLYQLLADYPRYLQ